MLSDEEMSDLYKFQVPWDVDKLTKEQLAVLILEGQAEERRISGIYSDKLYEQQSLTAKLKTMVRDCQSVGDRVDDIRKTNRHLMKMYEEMK